MSEEQRAAVCAEARTWLRTPYHHRAMIKGAGADCAMFPLAVYSACGVIERFDPGDYAQEWHLHRSDEIYLNLVDRVARRIPREAARAGDFGVWKFGRAYSHGAIVLGPPEIIHATFMGGCVHLGDMDRDDDLATRPAIFFSPWGD